MNSVDAAWVAGIIEGEGCLILNGKKARIAVSMTDCDVIQAIHQKTGVGNVHGPYKGGGSKGPDYWKEAWIWVVGSREEVRLIITAILPFLYERRTMQAMVCLDAMDKLDVASEYRKNFCPKGHAKPDCLESDGKHCKICRSIKYAIKKSEVN